MNLIKAVEESFRKDVPDFGIGDTLKVFVKVVEGDKERLQPFEGFVIARKGSGVRETFTLRKISFGVGVERIFPVHSPSLDKIEVLKRGDVRRQGSQNKGKRPQYKNSISGLQGYGSLRS